MSVSTSYDGYGRLLSYVRTGDPAQANAYNGLDERVGATSGSVTHQFVYDPDGRLMGEYDSSGAPVAETIWMSPSVANDSQPLGGDDGVGGYAPLAVATGTGSTGALYWVHGNHLGVPIVTTDASGAVATPPAYTMAGFPGQTHTLSDIYYNRYRDYDSSLGRYTQADPIGLAGGSNPYVYANDNPLRWTDPKGLDAILFEYQGYEVEYHNMSLPLGHAGVAAVDPTGAAFYYEFGLYDGHRCGEVRGPFYIGQLVYGKDGKPTTASLKRLAKVASVNYGKGSPTTAFFNRKSSDEVFAYAEWRKMHADDCTRPYKVFWDNCMTFARDAFGGIPSSILITEIP